MNIEFTSVDNNVSGEEIKRISALLDKIYLKHFPLKTYEGFKVRVVIYNALCDRIHQPYFLFNIKDNEYFEDVQKILSTDEARKDLSKLDFVNDVIENCDIALEAKIV